MWGDALALLQEAAPDLRIINLETSITRCCEFVPKGINYKMHPRNIDCLTTAGVDCCVLANNHVLDWGVEGLLETLDTLHAAGIRTAGAGRDAAEAAAPAIFEMPGGGRVLVFAFGMESSGIPRSWAAGPSRPGVNLLADASTGGMAAIAQRLAAVARPGDIAVASIHWGGNWGYEVPRDQQRLAHDLIDRAGFAAVHGHSSHHAKAMRSIAAASSSMAAAISSPITRGWRRRAGPIARRCSTVQVTPAMTSAPQRRWARPPSCCCGNTGEICGCCASGLLASPQRNDVC